MGVTQAQIAKLAGVSRGTVDRVINNRGRVSPAVEAKIKKIVRELGYQQNMAASLLVRSKKPIKLGIYIQSLDSPFMQCVLEELEHIRPEIRKKGAEFIVKSSKAIDLKEQLNALHEFQEEGVSGIALTPIENSQITELVNNLADQNIPVVTFNSDLPTSRRMCYVGQDSYLSGRTCAGLMNILLNGQGQVMIIAGHLSNLSHTRRLDGFCSEAYTSCPGISVLPLERSNDYDAAAYEITKRRLLEDSNIDGIYIVSNGQGGVCRAIRELNLQHKIKLVCHDITPETVQNLANDTIDFLIDQDAHRQASQPLDLLINYILTNEKPKEVCYYIRNDIRCKYNYM